MANLFPPAQPVPAAGGFPPRSSENVARRLAPMTLALMMALGAGAVGAVPDPADLRAAVTVQKMTLDEKLKLVFGYFSTDFKVGAKPKEGVPFTAGFVYGVE